MLLAALLAWTVVQVPQFACHASGATQIDSVLFVGSHACAANAEENVRSCSHCSSCRPPKALAKSAVSPAPSLPLDSSAPCEHGERSNGHHEWVVQSLLAFDAPPALPAPACLCALVIALADAPLRAGAEVCAGSYEAATPWSLRPGTATDRLLL